MKLSKYWTVHTERKFGFFISDEWEADHRREIMFVLPFRELTIGIDW